MERPWKIEKLRRNLYLKQLELRQSLQLPLRSLSQYLQLPQDSWWQIIGGGYSLHKARKERKAKLEEKATEITNEKIYLELLQIRVAVYSLAGVIILWVLPIIFVKVVSVLYKAVGVLPVYGRVVGAILILVLVFLWLAELGTNELDQSDDKKMPNK